MGEVFTSFLISVIAGVVSYYICKWLDRDKQAATAYTEQFTVTNKKTLRVAALRVFVLPMGIYQFPQLRSLYARAGKKSTKKKKDITFFVVIQREDEEEENTTFQLRCYTIFMFLIFFIQSFKKMVFLVSVFTFSIPLLYHCTIFMLYYVCDLLTMPNVLSIIKSIKISDRVSMYLKLKEENHEKK